VLAYVSRAASRETVLGLVDREGEVIETLGDPAPWHPYPSVSPDGRLIACRIRDGETANLWLTDVERGSRRRLTQGPGNHAWGSWDPTGKDFWYFDEQWAAEPSIFVMPANGTGEPREVRAHGHVPSVSPDGRWLIYTKLYDGGDDMDLWLLDLSRADAEPQPFLEGPGRQWVAAFSPEPPLVAYTTDASGQWEVSLTTYPARSGDWPMSTHGGWMPRWRGDGRELFYAVGDSILSVAVDPGDGTGPPVLSRPSLLFRRPRYGGDVTPFPDGFEAMPDGERFVLNLTTESDEDGPPPALVVVQSWLREFEQGK
jgi:Tol biopolymer transport system component